MISQWLYLLSLLAVIGCLALLDWRYRLAFWHDRRAVLLTLGIGLFVFVVWDIAAITLQIFNHGGSVYTLPIRLYRDFPLEEIFFLILLCYQALLLYLGTIRYIEDRRQ